MGLGYKGVEGVVMGYKARAERGMKTMSAVKKRCEGCKVR
jgi:hypothetical protein